MVKISIYEGKTQKKEPDKVEEVSGKDALGSLISVFCEKGCSVEEHTLIRAKESFKDHNVRIVVKSHHGGLGFGKPYLVVFEGPLCMGMFNLGMVSEWFVGATKSAGAKVRRKIFFWMKI